MRTKKIDGKVFAVTLPHKTIERFARLSKMRGGYVYDPFAEPVARGSEADYRAHIIRNLLEDASRAMEEAVLAIPPTEGYSGNPEFDFDRAHKQMSAVFGRIEIIPGEHSRQHQETLDNEKAVKDLLRKMCDPVGQKAS